MTTEEIVSADEFCIHHRVELEFITALNESGLIQIVYVEEKVFLPVMQLQYLEKLMRLHYQLDINLEGIEAIHHLLIRMKELEQQVTRLSNKLTRYEP